MVRAKVLAAAGSAVFLAATAVWAGHEGDILLSDDSAINYAEAPTTDPAELLNKKLASGEVKLDYSNNGLGYLPAILKAFNVNPDSQMLVFSKTSFQATRISPRAPRAIYFNDDVSVGYVQGSDVLEFATLDPKQGYMFYTLDNVKSDHPQFDRRDVCLQCHHGPATAGVPGIMVASVYPDSSGMPFARLGMPATDHRTRFDERWGGWYVTGTHGGMRHRGNAVARDRLAPDVLEMRDAQNQTDLSKKFDITPYLEKTSDIVALMTQEHQTRKTNLLKRLNWEKRIDGKASDATIEVAAKYMTFQDEAKMLDTVKGSSTFQQTFPQRGPRDPQGRSLRDYDLQTRLFKYPLSYMIYSDVFDALPAETKDRLYAKVLEKIKPDARKDILEIVTATKPNVPAAWKTAAAEPVAGQ
jgi:hypothetical protein